MRKAMVRVAAVLAALLLSLGLTAGAAQAQQRDDIVIGPPTVCKIITFFDFVIFEYDCVHSA